MLLNPIIGGLERAMWSDAALWGVPKGIAKPIVDPRTKEEFVPEESLLATLAATGARVIDLGGEKKRQLVCATPDGRTFRYERPCGLAATSLCCGK